MSYIRASIVSSSDNFEAHTLKGGLQTIRHFLDKTNGHPQAFGTFLCKNPDVVTK